MKAVQRESPVRPPGEPKTLKAAALEKGAEWLQNFAPVRQFDIYVVGFHCAKEDPAMQMEAHHYCRQVNQEFIQCTIFDGNTADANLIGVEYIISERLFEQAPDEEKALWHPHNYEVFSGELVAPGLPGPAEKELMKMLVNSYGKTWHLWHSGRHDGSPGDALPYGNAQLMWSFNRDGEVDESLRQHRNRAMEIDIAAKRSQRADFISLAHPQRGVDLLMGKFPNADRTPPPGVRDVAAQDDARS